MWMYVNPPSHLCLFIYVNLSQRVPAVTSMSVSFLFLKPMISNNRSKGTRPATGSMLALFQCLRRGLCCVNREPQWPPQVPQFHSLSDQPIGLIWGFGSSKDRAWGRGGMCPMGVWWVVYPHTHNDKVELTAGASCQVKLIHSYHFSAKRISVFWLSW